MEVGMNSARRLWVGAALMVVATAGTGAWADAVATGPARKPTLFLIGDSTVKNGRDTGTGNQWGWGHLLPAYFDLSKITVENDAVGGTSSRSFFEEPGMWPRVLAKVQPGDFVIMQFGTNDNTMPPESDTLRYRSTIKGNGEETVQGPVKGGGMETVHSYGWYMRQFIAQTQAKGAAPIVCSMIPHKSWVNGKAGTAAGSYELWTKQAVEQAGGNAQFLPLNKIIAEHYDQLGEKAVNSLFASEKEHTHTDWAGAKLNAQCVVEGIRALPESGLEKYLATTPGEMKEPATMPAGKAANP
jgi:lysophospholipase L1-like esterase